VPPCALTTLSRLSNLQVLHVFDTGCASPVTQGVLPLMAQSWPGLKELYIQGHLEVSDLGALRPLTALHILDLYHVHEDSPFSADLSVLPHNVHLLGLQNCEVVNAHLAARLCELLENTSLYHEVIWRPERNGGLELFTFLGRCTALHSLTLEYDMGWFAGQLRSWRNRFTPIHGIRQVSSLRHLELFFADSGPDTPPGGLDSRLVSDLCVLTRLEHLEVWNAYGDDWAPTDLRPLSRLTRLRQLRMEALPPPACQPLRRAMAAAVPQCRVRLVADNEPFEDVGPGGPGELPP